LRTTKGFVHRNNDLFGLIHLAFFSYFSPNEKKKLCISAVGNISTTLLKAAIS